MLVVLNQPGTALRCAALLICAWIYCSAFPAFALDETKAKASDVAVNDVARNEMPRFPSELVGVKAGDGKVVMVVTVNAQGAVIDSVVLEATNEAFARSANSAVSDWRFNTAAASSNAISSTVSSSINQAQGTFANDATFPRREVLEFSFKRSGVVTTLSHAEGARESFVTSTIPQLRTLLWNQLDAEPQRLSGNFPSLPKTALASLGVKPLFVNFVIDREGLVRVPVVPASLDPELANAVLAAVRSWCFTPPLYQQKPVAVEVTKAIVLPKK